MAKTPARRTHSTSNMPSLNARLREAALICLLAIALGLFLALVTYSQFDGAWSQTGTDAVTRNMLGPFGAWFSDIAFFIFGYLAYMFPVLFAYSGFVIYQARFDNDRDYLKLALRLLGFVCILISGCVLLHLSTDYTVLQRLPMGEGGVLGYGLGIVMQQALNVVGAGLVSATVLLMGVTLSTGLSWLSALASLLATVRSYVSDGLPRLQRMKQNMWQYISTRTTTTQTPPPVSSPAAIVPVSSQQQPRPAKTANKLPVLVKSVPKKSSIVPCERAVEEKQAGSLTVKTYDLPAFSLLEPTEASQQSDVSESALKQMSQLVEARLSDFGVDVAVVAVHPGPVITRFELQLAPGIKASKITGLARDLARSLSVISVRVVEIIPGKSVVGLELPNAHRQIVRLRELLSSEQYESTSSPLSMALGKDIAGAPVIVDLAKMPHLLVAGTTGSGKSVGVNAMLISMLYKSQPDAVRMIMIDPKMLELSVYDGIPHLLAPVVTDMKEAANALKWCVAEMERRYQLMAALSVRNLAGYNKKVNDAIKRNAPIPHPAVNKQASNDVEEKTLIPLPHIVVVVDEFADMMMVVGKKVEELIARIAQKARAAGIHLILATQRPSVDVITGLIKANVPTRIAFQVASRIDSRTILDQQGAEQLLGKGDMLYLPTGAGLPTRIHGAFVADAEVLRVVNDWKERASPEYCEELVGGFAGSTTTDAGFFAVDSEESVDELYDHAVMIVTETRRASISLVQRRLKIGYNRAARLVEQMEAQGVVTAMQSNGTREVIAPPPVSVAKE